MAGSKGKYETKIKISGEVLPSFSQAMKTAEAELIGLYQKARRENAGFMAGVDGLDKMADKTFSMVGKAVKVTAGVGAGILAASTAVGMGYEEQMSTVQSISNASEADMKRLDKLAQEMGRNTKFSAKEAGQGLEYMAMAGWKTDQMVAGLPGILNLAAASGEDLGMVSDIVTDDLTAFGMAAEEAGRFSDVLAAAASNSNTNVSMMGETFKYAAPVAGALGYTIEDVALATGLMANAGIKAENAGTAMRSLFTNMAKPTKDMSKYMNRLGISLTDNKGKMKTFREQLESIREGFSGLSEAQRAEYAAGIAGKYGMSGLLAIVNANESDFTKLADSIDNSAGAAERMAKIRIDNLAGDFVLLKSAAEGAGIGIYDTFSDIAREGVQAASGLINNFTESEFLSEMGKTMPSVRREMKQFGKAMGEFAEPLITTGKWFLKHPDVIAGTLTGIGSALLTFKAAKGITNIVSAFGALAGMTAAWPVAAAGLAIGGIAGISAAIKTAENEAAKANLAQHFGDISLSIKELDQAARNVFGEGFLGDLEALGEIGKANAELKRSLDESLREIQKENWKVNIGIAFDKEDEESYRASVESYVKTAQDYIANRGYEIQMAAKIIFGNAQTGEDADGSTDEFYKGLDDEVRNLSEQLNEILNTELSESFTIQDKHAKAAQLLNDIAEITDIVAVSQNTAKLQLIEDKYGGTDLLDSETFQNLQQEVAEYSKSAAEGLESSYELTLAGLDAQREAGARGKAGGISQEEYDTRRLEALKAYNEQRAQIMLDAYNLTKEVAQKTYGLDENIFNEAGNAFQAKVPDILTGRKSQEQKIAGLAAGWEETLNEVGIDATSQKAIEKLTEGLLPVQEQMDALAEQLHNTGQQIPESLKKGINDAEMLRALGGSYSDMWSVIGREIAENPEALNAVQTMREEGRELPDALANSLEANTGIVQEAAGNLLRTVEDSLGAGINANIPFNAIITTTLKTANQVGKIPEKHADGGLITQPTLSYFAEDGPEMAIPINNSRRAVSLWQETGRLLGVYNQNNYEKTYEHMSENNTAVSWGNQGQSLNLAYAPIMNFYGDTSKEDVEDAGITRYEQFCEWMNRYQYEKLRTGFT